MDFILYRLTADGPAPMPHGEQSRFPSEGDASARAYELRGAAASLGDKILPAFVVMSETGETILEIKGDGVPPVRITPVEPPEIDVPAYIRNSGGVCPVDMCGGSPVGLVARDTTAPDGTWELIWPQECLACGATWHEVFRLTDIRNLQQGEK